MVKSLTPSTRAELARTLPGAQPLCLQPHGRVPSRTPRPLARRTVDRTERRPVDAAAAATVGA
jgi:hypothetical protein